MSDIKAVILGDHQVGKKSLLANIKTNDNNQMQIHDAQLNTEHILTFDISPLIVDHHYPCYIFVFDLSKKKSLEYLEQKYWHELIPHLQRNFSFLFLVGNKSDTLIQDREVTPAMIDQSAKSLQIQYVEISNTTKKNIDFLVKSLKIRVAQHIKKNQQKSSSSLYQPMSSANSHNNLEPKPHTSNTDSQPKKPQDPSQKSLQNPDSGEDEGEDEDQLSDDYEDQSKSQSHTNHQHRHDQNNKNSHESAQKDSQQSQSVETSQMEVPPLTKPSHQNDQVQHIQKKSVVMNEEPMRGNQERKQSGIPPDVKGHDSQKGFHDQTKNGHDSSKNVHDQSQNLHHQSSKNVYDSSKSVRKSGTNSQLSSESKRISQTTFQNQNQNHPAQQQNNQQNTQHPHQNTDHIQNQYTPQYSHQHNDHIQHQHQQNPTLNPQDNSLSNNLLQLQASMQNFKNQHVNPPIKNNPNQPTYNSYYQPFVLKKQFDSFVPTQNNSFVSPSPLNGTFYVTPAGSSENHSIQKDRRESIPNQYQKSPQTPPHIVAQAKNYINELTDSVERIRTFNDRMRSQQSSQNNDEKQNTMNNSENQNNYTQQFDSFEAKPVQQKFTYPTKQMQQATQISQSQVRPVQHRIYQQSSIGPKRKHLVENVTNHPQRLDGIDNDINFHQFEQRNITEMSALDKSIVEIEKSLQGLNVQVQRNRLLDNTLDTQNDTLQLHNKESLNRSYTNNRSPNSEFNEILNATYFQDVFTTKDSATVEQFKFDLKTKKDDKIPVFQADIQTQRVRDISFKMEDTYNTPQHHPRKDLSAFIPKSYTRNPEPSQYQRKLKPCLNLQIEYCNRLVDIKIFPQDNAFFVAERILQQLNKPVDRFSIKRLAPMIQTKINVYCEEINQLVKEVQKRKLRLKDMLEDYITKRNNQNYQKKEKNQTFESAQAIGKIIVELGQNKSATLYIHQDSEAYELAFQFIVTYKLKKNKINLLVDQIIKIQETWQKSVVNDTTRN